MTATRVTITKDEWEEAFSRCSEVIRGGGVIAYPTDTFYGLGADPRNASAVEKLFSVKERGADQPVLLLVSDARMVREWAVSVPMVAEQLMARFWPGPLTIVLPARPDVVPSLTAGTGRIGLRVPGNELTRTLLAHVGGALTGTSANRSGGPDPRSAADVLRELGDRIDMVLDGGVFSGGSPSTVVDVTSGRLVILRQGAIAEDALLS
jgi:L-threonylcarbamoyladenylate synthase